MRVWSKKMTVWLNRSRNWLAAQPVVVAVTNPQKLRGRDLGQTLVQVFVPILAFVLVIGGGIGAALSQTGAQQSDSALEQPSETIASSQTELEPQNEPEPEVYHPVAQYMANVEELRQEINKVRPYLHWQRNRLAEVLAWTEVREWTPLEDLGDQLCFQNDDTVECIGQEQLDLLRAEGLAFAEANPRGIGLCYDWFGDVCMSGDWFPSRAAFTSFVAGSKTYVMTGDKALVEETNFANPLRPRSEVSVHFDGQLYGATEWDELVAEKLAADARLERDFTVRLDRDQEGCVEWSDGRKSCLTDDQLENWKEQHQNGREENAGNPFIRDICFTYVSGVCMEGESYDIRDMSDEEYASYSQPNDGGGEPAPEGGGSDDGGGEPAPEGGGSDDGGGEPAPEGGGSDDGGGEPAPEDGGD